MKKVTAGPTLKKYADLFDCEISDVIDWVNGYINGPWCNGLPFEATEELRAVAIKGYISEMVAV